MSETLTPKRDEHGRPVISGVVFEDSGMVRPVERYAGERDYQTDSFVVARLQHERDTALRDREELFRQNEAQRELIHQLADENQRLTNANDARDLVRQIKEENGCLEDACAAKDELIAELRAQIVRLEAFGNEMCDKYARQSSALSKAAERNQVKRCEELTARCQQMEAEVTAMRLENAKLRGESAGRERTV